MNISDAEFDQLVEEAIEGIDPPFRTYLDVVPVIVEDYPDAAVCRAMKLNRDELLGLFQGIALPERHVDGPDGPNQIYLYRRNLLAGCRTRRQLARQIRQTLVHELAHLLGFSEQQIRELHY